MLKNTHQYTVLKKILQPLLNEWAIFECYGDSIATFGYYEELGYHQFCVICDDDFSREIMICDLIELKRTTFFEYKFIVANEIIESFVWVLDENKRCN